MKRKIFTAAIASLILAASAASVPAGAEKTYTAVKGETTAFDKYLVLNEGANVPNVSFAYTVEAGTAQNFDADGKTIAVYAGLTPEKIAFSGTDITDENKTDSEFEISFAQGDDTVLYASKKASDYVKNLDAGEKYVKKTAQLDFSDVAFDEPGIYRYVITEKNNNAQGVTYDADDTRILDVYVEDATPADGEPALKVSAYILHASDETITIDNTTYGSDGEVISGSTAQGAGKGTSDYKSQGFTNEYSAYDLTFSKAVSGNQASKDKYFAFTVNIENAVAGTVYDISYTDDNNENTTDGNADQTISANPNSATTVITAAVTQPENITVRADGTLEQTFYLQHGQKIVLRGLAEGTKYTVTDGKEDYTAAYVTDDVKDTAETKTDTAMNASGIDQDVIIDFTNTRKGTIPTGVLLSVAAPATAGVIAVGGIAYLLLKNKRREDEEE